MRPLKKFLQLTTKTYPNGHEAELIKHLPKDYKIDNFGNKKMLNIDLRMDMLKQTALQY